VTCTLRTTSLVTFLTTSFARLDRLGIAGFRFAYFALYKKPLQTCPFPKLEMNKGNGFVDVAPVVVFPRKAGKEVAKSGHVQLGEQFRPPGADPFDVLELLI